MMRAGTKWCFDSEEPVPAARHYIRRNSSEPLVLNCYVSPPCKFLLRKNGGLTALFTFSYVTCGPASDCAEQLPSDYLNRTKVKRSSADFGREGSAVEIDDFEKDIPH